MLTGSIVQTEPSFVVTSQLVDVQSGNIVASERITCDRGETIFGTVDRLTLATRNDLVLPQETMGDTDASIADATTHSLVAYRHSCGEIVDSDQLQEQK